MARPVTDKIELGTYSERTRAMIGPVTYGLDSGI